MAIDTNTHVQAGFFYRWMSVRRMKEILGQMDLEDDDLLVPNRVGNLSVYRPDRDLSMYSDDIPPGAECIGFIDFNSEVYESLCETLNMIECAGTEGPKGAEDD